MADWSLIAKYIKQEELTPEEKQRVETWISESEANERAFADMQQVMRPSKPLPDFNRTLEEDWTKIMQTGSQPISDVKIRRIQPLTITKIAASILLVCLAGWVLILMLNRPEEFVALDTIREIQLKDGSTVWLNKHSKLLVAADFNESVREVTLEGEAYFEVAHNPEKRFTVNSPNVQTQVLGTKFNVRNDEKNNVEVIVTEGKVSVASPEHALLIVKDESAFYWAERKSLLKDEHADQNQLSWKTGVIRFDGIYLSHACRLLSEHYGVDVTAAEDVKEYQITSVLDNLTFDQAIEVVVITLDLRMEKKNNQVFLSK